MASSDLSLERSISSLSIHSNDSESSQMDLDWDRSLTLTRPKSPNATISTPRNSVLFPIEDSSELATPGQTSAQPLAHARQTSVEGKGKRTLSELLKMHAEKGTNCAFTPEEAKRVCDVLGQWINSSSSPYEADDDFFVRGKDDLFIPSKRIEALVEGRQRGFSESTPTSRPPSSTGQTNHS